MVESRPRTALEERSAYRPERDGPFAATSGRRHSRRLLPHHDRRPPSKCHARLGSAPGIVRGPLPATPAPASDVLDALVKAADGGLVGTAGPRYFGFVIGGSLHAATAADILATGWDQCAFSGVVSSAAVAAEEAAGAWLKELLLLPATASVGFVTGAQAANTVGLAAARHHVLAAAGWDVEADGLYGAPRVRIVAGAERHATIDRALRLLGFGTNIVEPVAADRNGAINVEDLARVLGQGGAGPVIVCLQAGNVNTGAVDPLRAASEIARRHGAWIHATAPSDCGQRRARGGSIWSRVLSWGTRGPVTVTSG